MEQLNFNNIQNRQLKGKRLYFTTSYTNPDGSVEKIRLEIGEPTRLVNDEIFGLYDSDIFEVINIIIRDRYTSKAKIRKIPRQTPSYDCCDPDFGEYDRSLFTVVNIPLCNGRLSRALIRREDADQCK